MVGKDSLRRVDEAHMAYRPDIDGLRAIAVLSVVTYHAFPTVLPGGFVGVDIFFCISGYLITSIITKGLGEGSFKFISFYSARARRLFPSLVLVLVFCLLVGVLILAPSEYRALGWHTSAGSFFLSNFAYLSESGYFDADAQTKPLLHLWSLAVEEQFYIFWPFAIILSRRRGSIFTIVALAVAVTSFGYGLALLWKQGPLYSPAGAYYLPFSRFWELMLGAMLTPLSRVRVLLDRTSPNGRSFVGSVLLVASLIFISSRHAYPGYWALMPTMGTVMLISAGPTAIFNKYVLSNRFLVGIGLISYPLYLWHWPLLSFPRILEGDIPGPVVRLAAVLLAAALAWLSYQFFERPIRFTSAKLWAHKPLVAAICALGLAGLVVVAAPMSPAHIVRTAENGDVGHDAFHAYMKSHFAPCGPSRLHQAAPRWNGIVRCYQTNGQIPRQVAVIGDSHAEHIFPGLADHFPNVNFVYYLGEGIPSLGNPSYGAIYKYVLSDSSIKTVILSAYWAPGINRVGMQNALGDMRKTILDLHSLGKKVILIKDVPDFEVDPERCKFVRPFIRQRCSETLESVLSREGEGRHMIDELSSIADVSQADPLSEFCPNNECHAAMAGSLLYRDRNHLSKAGSDFMMAGLANAPEFAVLRVPSASPAP
jgi:peptidoglycan/LPS O-acetylase OafA/YrhL